MCHAAHTVCIVFAQVPNIDLGPVYTLFGVHTQDFDTIVNSVSWHNARGEAVRACALLFLPPPAFKLPIISNVPSSSAFLRSSRNCKQAAKCEPYIDVIQLC